MAPVHALVLNAPNTPFTDPGLLIEPIDILTVATWIKKLGLDVTVRDLDREQIAGEFVGPVLDEISPEVVIIPFDYHIPLYTVDAAHGVRQIIKQCRERDIPVILGGRPSNVFPEQFIIDSEVIVVVGEMEPALKDLLSGGGLDPGARLFVPGLIINDRGHVRKTPPRKQPIEFASLPIPDRSLLNLAPYIDVRTLLTSRGCVERCAFCPVHTFWGRWRRRPAALVVDEIQMLVEKHGAQKVLLLDDHATANPRRMRDISTELLARRITVALGCLGTVSSIDQSTLELMALAGFRWIHYGAEFGDDNILKKLRKGITVQQIRAAVQATKRAGIRVRTSWIFDAPFADESSLKRTCDLVLELEPDEVRAHFLSLRACAPLHSERLQNGAPMPEQYIHAPTPHSSLEGNSPEIVLRWTSWLTERLVGKGYQAVRTPDEWSATGAGPCSAGERFISFCPGKYGVGWIQ